ncbi:hypothetical protein GCM10020219_084380 [Nonomuraea dietziae]
MVTEIRARRSSRPDRSTKARTLSCESVSAVHASHSASSEGPTASGAVGWFERERHGQRRDPVLLGEGVELAVQPSAPWRVQRRAVPCRGPAGGVAHGQPDEGSCDPVKKKGEWNE